MKTVWLKLCCILVLWGVWAQALPAFSASLDQLTDLTGKVQTIVTLKGRDNFVSEYHYDITVRNLSPDAFVADSLIIVLDRITNLAGEDHEALTGESFLKRFDILGEDGHTAEGKPYFHIPVGTIPDLIPQAESAPAVIRIRNRDYVAVFTPSFRVFGQKRPPKGTKGGESSASAAGASNAANRAAMDRLIQLLRKKGILTEEEARKLTQP